MKDHVYVRFQDEAHRDEMLDIINRVFVNWGAKAALEDTCVALPHLNTPQGSRGTYDPRQIEAEDAFEQSNKPPMGCKASPANSKTLLPNHRLQTLKQHLCAPKQCLWAPQHSL